MNASILFRAVFVVLLILLSAFFSSAETAMTTINRIRVQALVEQGDKKAVILEKVIANSARMLSTILIGNNIVNMAVSALVTTLTIDVLGNAYVGAATGILTLLILLFGEITPKSMAAVHAEKMALAYARPVYVLMILLRPVVFLVEKLSRGLIRLFGVAPDGHGEPMTEYELRTLVNESQKDGVIETDEKQMIYNVVDFGDSAAKDVMVPRIDMTFVEVNAARSELLEIFREDRHTRFPVYEGNTDNVIGTVNIKDLLLFQDEDFSLRNLLRPPYFTYEHKPTRDLLLEMRKASVNMAIVLDEYGSTAGLVTLEDLLEEIVGEIRDEYDEDETEDLVEIRPGREYKASGSARLEDVSEALGITLSSEEYDSLGGFMIEQLDTLPHEGESLLLPCGVRLVVDSISNNRIRQIHIWLPEEE